MARLESAAALNFFDQCWVVMGAPLSPVKTMASGSGST